MKNALDLNKYSSTYSAERLKSFIYSENDTIEDVAERYGNNVIISQALYPALCTLEIILRNAIDTVLKSYISKTWIEDEIKNNTLLEEIDYRMLINAYDITKKECRLSSKPFTIGKVIANLNFGFWTNLCVKKYSPRIWNRMECFKGVFVNYPNNKPEIAIISKKLYTIRKFRNRIFHYEPIFKKPQKTLELYNNMLEIISYLPNDNLQILNKTSVFLDVYNSLMISAKQKT